MSISRLFGVVALGGVVATLIWFTAAFRGPLTASADSGGCVHTNPRPTPTPAVLRSVDLNDDPTSQDTVDLTDILDQLQYYTQNVPPAPSAVDTNADGKITLLDVTLMASYVGSGSCLTGVSATTPPPPSAGGTFDYTCSSGCIASDGSEKVPLNGNFSVTVSLTSAPAAPYGGVSAVLVYDSSLVSLTSIDGNAGALWTQPYCGLNATSSQLLGSGGTIGSDGHPVGNAPILTGSLRAGVAFCTGVPLVGVTATGTMFTFHFTAGPTPGATGIDMVQDSDLPGGAGSVPRELHD